VELSGEKWPTDFACDPTSMFFNMPQICDFPSERKHAEEFFCLKKSDGFGQV
jgi:hypothetical protein